MKNNYVFDDELIWKEVYEGWYDQGHLEEHYNAYKGKPQDLSLPTLAPPKRFLQSGSVYWVSPNVKYTFGESAKRPYATEVAVRKYHNIDNKLLRLLKIEYFFIRDKNVMSEKKGRFVSIVYNVETKALYLRQSLAKLKTTKKGTISNKHAWDKSIKRISLNGLPLKIALDHFDISHRRRFVEDLKAIVSKDVPDVCDICNGSGDRVIALILQHRIGKSIPNLNDNFISNLSLMTRDSFVSNRMDAILSTNRSLALETDEDWEAYDKAKYKLKRNSVYKFIPTLKGTGSIKKALKTMLGECYMGIYPKLLFEVDFENSPMGGENAMIKYKNDVPKAIQHYVIGAFRNMPLDEFKDLFKEIMSLARAGGDSAHIKDSWIRTVRRLNVVIPWHTWKDTYRMGGELGVRIRPNNFTNIQSIYDMHDAFSTIIRRNRDLTNSALNVDQDTKFIEVVYPKEFEGCTFQQLLSPRELVDESSHMGHCVHTYDRSCLKGTSILFSAKDAAGKKWTVEYSGENLEFVQAEGQQSENGGMRFFCPNEVAQDIFLPFAIAMSRLNRSSVPYKQHCMVNIAITNLEHTVKGLKSVIKLNLPSVKISDLKAELDTCGSLLVDLASIKAEIKEGKISPYKTSARINAVLGKVAELNYKEERIRGRQRAVQARIDVPDVPQPAVVLPPDNNNLFTLNALDFDGDDDEEFPF